MRCCIVIIRRPLVLIPLSEVNRVLRAALCIPAMFVALTAFGAEPATIAHPCAVIEDGQERLACYDAAFPRPVDRPVREEVPDADSTQTDKRSQDFGLSEAQLRAREPERARDKRVELIEATVVGIRYRSSGERIITLDNGQVWLQTEVTVRGPLTEGDQVNIRRAALGSFMLVTPGRVALRVRRME